MSSPGFDADINAWRVRAMRQRATIEALAARASKAFRLVPESVRYQDRIVIVSRTTTPGNSLPWRVTYFDAHGPSGHNEAKSPADAIEDAWRVYGPLVLVESV
jgi:hypothetical protein